LELQKKTFKIQSHSGNLNIKITGKLASELFFKIWVLFISLLAALARPIQMILKTQEQKEILYNIDVIEKNREVISLS